jgi:hypothetical protein
MARGVSAETLRRRLGIRAENMDHLIVAAGCLPADQESPKPRPAPVVQDQPPPIEVAPAASAITRDDILRAVADAWDTTPQRLLIQGAGPKTRLAPRKAVFLLMRRLMGMNYTAIAAALNMTHRSAVQRGAYAALGLYKFDADWRRRFDLAEAALRARAA